MIDRRSMLEAARQMRHDPFDREALPEMLSHEVSSWDMSPKARRAVLAASMASLASSLNSGAGAFVADFYRPLRPGRLPSC